MKRFNRIAAGIALALVLGSASAGNDYDYCLLCHGANANGNYGIRAPKISGMEPWYLATQLANYQAGLRGADERDTYGAQMRAIVATLPDEKAITDVVAYINTLK